jgi:hypothetical protein
VPGGGKVERVDLLLVAVEDVADAFFGDIPDLVVVVVGKRGRLVGC